MSKKAIDYINNEIKLSSDKLQEIDYQINSNNIELNLIKKKISNIKKNHDFTADIFHSVNSEINDDDISKLVKAKEETEKQIEILKTSKLSLQEHLEELKNILIEDREDDSENVSRETFDSFSSITMLEKDRQRTSRDIHDSIVQNLTALVHKQELIYNIVDKDINRAKLEIKNTKNIIKNSINELREIIFNLRPTSLDDLGIKEAVSTLYERYRNNNEGIFFELEMEFDEKNISLPDELSISIIRIIQELTSNSIKHSDCNKVSLLLKIVDKIYIEYLDNGKGFDYFNTHFNKESNTGYGIEMLNERIRMHKGMIDYFENDNKYIIEIPIV